MLKRARITYSETRTEYLSGYMTVVYDDSEVDIEDIKEAIDDYGINERTISRRFPTIDIEAASDVEHDDSEHQGSDTTIDSIEDIEEDTPKEVKSHLPDWW